jgi:hypothetical protein
MSLFEPEVQVVFERHGFEFDFMKANDSAVTLVALAWKLNAEIEAAKSGDSETVKAATHPYDVKASKDKKAGAIAADIIRGFIAACDSAISANKNVAWHLAQSDSDAAAYLTSEMQYWRFKTAPAKPVTSGTKLDELRNDRKVITQKARDLLEAMPILAKDERLVIKDGKVALPNLQGAGVRNSDTPTGRHAKWGNTTWNIDGVIFPKGTDPRDLVRVIWPGLERVGKKPSDIFNVIEEIVKRDKLTLEQRKHMEFDINGHHIIFDLNTGGDSDKQ